MDAYKLSQSLLSIEGPLDDEARIALENQKIDPMTRAHICRALNFAFAKGSAARESVMEARITEVLELLDGMEDIVDGEHGPLPNLAMQVATILNGRAP